MSDLLVLDEAAVLPHLVAASWEDAIGQLGARMCEVGFTEAVYTQNVIEREREFPTALQFASAAIALPHGEAEHVWVSSMAIGRCERPVAFHAMDDASKLLDVQLIVMLAVNDPEAHLGVLAKLFEVLADPSFVDGVLAMDTADGIATAFKDALGLGR